MKKKKLKKLAKECLAEVDGYMLDEGGYTRSDMAILYDMTLGEFEKMMEVYPPLKRRILICEQFQFSEDLKRLRMITLNVLHPNPSQVKLFFAMAHRRDDTIGDGDDEEKDLKLEITIREKEPCEKKSKKS